MEFYTGVPDSLLKNYCAFRHLHPMVHSGERFGAAPKLGLGVGRLCGRGTAGLVFAPHVPCEVTLVSCPVCTFLACIWFDARVRPHVHCESTLVSCPVCTFVACVWFDARLFLLPLLRLVPGHPVSPLLLPGATCPTTLRLVARALSFSHCDPGISKPPIWRLRPDRQTGIVAKNISKKKICYRNNLIIIMHEN